MEKPKSPGRIAAETWYMKTYRASSAVAESYWRTLTRKEMRVWEIVAGAVREAHPCPHPWIDVEFFISLIHGITKAKCTRCGKDL